MSKLTFEDVARIGRDRSDAWHPSMMAEWTVSDWAVALMGEAGEICDAIKKLRRFEIGASSSNNPLDRAEALVSIATELGDTFLYLDLLAQRLGLTLEDCIRETFNRVSIREGLPHRLGDD